MSVDHADVIRSALDWLEENRLERFAVKPGFMRRDEHRAALDALVAERDALREERDATKRVMGEWLDKSESRVKELEAALRSALDIITWMSGADAFSPGGEAQEGWVKCRDEIDRLFGILGGGS